MREWTHTRVIRIYEYRLAHQMRRDSQGVREEKPVTNGGGKLDTEAKEEA